MRPKVSLQLAQTGSTQADLDFGQLEKGKTRQADIQVKHNTPYLLQLSSQNAGVLRNPQHPQSTIAYRLLLDGRHIDLQNTLQIPGNATSSTATTQHQLRIEIQEVERTSHLLAMTAAWPSMSVYAVAICKLIANCNAKYIN